MHPNMLTYVCGKTSTQSVREKLPGQRRWAHTSELSCVEWGHFEVLKKTSSFHLHHYQLPCGVSAMATNTRHTLTQTRRHTPSPYFSLVVLTHIVLPHFTIKKKEKKRQPHKEERQPCVTAALTSTCLDQITNATTKKMSACIAANR